MSELIKYDTENKKCKYLIGTDEAGRGPAAGDVYAAAVCFLTPPSGLLEELNDSKKLTEAKREQLAEIIKANSIYSIRRSTIEQIEKHNILVASLTAMKRSCYDVARQLNSQDIETFVDGNKTIPNYRYPQKYIVKGDGKSASIAAASILAKVERDKAMMKLDKQFPQYYWAKNKGYLSAAHIEAIKSYGITKYHRKLFVRNILNSQESTQLKIL